MHPVIRVASLLLLAGTLPFASPLALLVVAGALLVAYLAFAAAYFPAWLNAVWRIRWLLFAILILYLWFTPGQPVFVHPHINAPSWQGMQLGVFRCAVLLLLLGAVQLLLGGLQRDQLVAALIWLTRPLAALGVNTTVFARRLALCLEWVPTAQATMARVIAGDTATAKNRIAHIAAVAAQALQQPIHAVPEVSQVALPKIPLWQMAGVVIAAVGLWWL